MVIRSLSATPIRVQLELENTPSNVTLVRSLIAALAEIIGLGSDLSTRLCTAVSEAANNAVLHAYSDGSGPIRVSIVADADAVDVRVTDHGHGMQPALPSPNRMGVGLSVIMAVADRAEIVSRPDEGVEVRLRFLRESDVPMPGGESAHSPQRTLAGGHEGDIVVSLEPRAALAPILGNLSAAVAAQHWFRTERIVALGEVTDTLSEVATMADDAQTVGFAITAAGRSLDLTLGPLQVGAGLKTQASKDRSGAPLGGLLDDLSVEAVADDGEFVTVRVSDPGRGG